MMKAESETQNLVEVLGNETIKKLQTVFSCLDSNKDGVANLSDVEALIPTVPPELEKVFMNGLTFLEFAYLFSQQLEGVLSTQEIEDYINLIEKSVPDFLNTGVFSKTLLSVDPELKQKELDSLLLNVAIEDGKISGGDVAKIIGEVKELSI